MKFNKHFKFNRGFLTMLLGALAFISEPVTSTACTNIFPKVFGADQAYNTGGIQNTFLV
jgi:hypothetical protein